MKNLLCGVVVVALVLGLFGCVIGDAPVYGGLVTDDVRGGVALGDGDVSGTKVGRSTAKGIICYASGDASIQAAAADGKITKVHYVDSEVFSVLTIYARYTTIVYGQ
jgi:TRL-like protein family